MSIAGRMRLVYGLLAMAMWPSVATAQQDVGVYAAVNAEATVTPPGGLKRTLVIGLNAIYHEHVVTGLLGQTEIEFLDQSSLTMGPNAELDIDEFVYDPNAATGKISLSTTRGLLRYVGGKISKLDGAVTMHASAAKIGIRGGEILVNIGPGGALTVILVYGKQLTVTGTTGATQELSRVGYAITVSHPGARPSAPYPASSAMIAGYLAQLDGRAGGTGGAPVVPTNQTLASSNVPATISADLAGSIRAANQNQPPAAAAPAIDLAGLQTDARVNLVQGQSALLNSTVVPSQPTSPAPVSFSTSGAAMIVLSKPRDGQFSGTLSYPDPSLQNGTLSVTVQNVVQANPGVTIKHGQQLLSSVPNFAAYLAGLSGGAALGPLTAGGTNIPVTLKVAGSYNGPPIPARPTPITNTSVNLVASGTATVSADGQFFSADLLNSSIFLFGGVPTVTMPTTGIGTFAGTASASVFNSGAAYAASAPFTETYNFGSNSGQLRINNFDGASYTSALGGSGNTYSGSLSGVTSRTGSVAGGFYGPNAAETGGTFSITSVTGPRYVATGIFASH